VIVIKFLSYSIFTFKFSSGVGKVYSKDGSTMFIQSLFTRLPTAKSQETLTLYTAMITSNPTYFVVHVLSIELAGDPA
jgi:hypothetical protein